MHHPFITLSFIVNVYRKQINLLRPPPLIRPLWFEAKGGPQRFDTNLSNQGVRIKIKETEI